MKKYLFLISILVLTLTASAQTLNVVVGNVTYQFPATQAGDMTYTGSTQLTICGKKFNIADINKIYIDNATVTDNEVAVAYESTSAKVTVAGNVAQYVAPIVTGAHVGIIQSNTEDVDGNEITYSLSGTSSDGEFYLKGSYKCSIDLCGVSLTNLTPVHSGAALHIQNGKRINISVKKDTENTLADCASPSDDMAQKAALYVKGHAEFKGKGTLNVYGRYKHAIKTGEYLTIKNCTVNVKQSAGDGINCNEYFLMESGAIALSNIGDDGIQASIDEDIDATTETTDHEDENSGNVYLLDGTISGTISTAAAKGIKSDGAMNIFGGAINLTVSGGGAIDYTLDSSGNPTTTFSSTSACSALKSDGDMTITGGTLKLTATGAGGKGLSGDGNLYVKGGDITVKTTGGIVYYSNKTLATTTSSKTTERLASNYKSSPKGIKFDGNIAISGGTISVTASYHEGIESKGTIDITGGTIYAQSSDDAINAASHLTINGGITCAYSTGNDGIDSNGNTYIKSGIIYAIGSSSPEVGVDTNTEGNYKLYVTGGTIVAIGGLESGAQLTQTCYQLGSSSSGGNRPGFPGNNSSSSWSKSTWYALCSNGTPVLAFKTPASGGSALVVSTSGTTTMKVSSSSNAITVDETIWNGMGSIGTISGGAAATLSTYSGGQGRF